MCSVRSSCQTGDFFRSLFSRDLQSLFMRWPVATKMLRLRPVGGGAVALAHEFRFRLRGDLLDEASDHHWTTAVRVGIIRVDEHEADNSELNRRRSGKGRQATIQIDETREACGQHGERSWKQDASRRVVRQLKAAVIPRRDEGAAGNPRARLPLTREDDTVRGECGHTGNG